MSVHQVNEKRRALIKSGLAAGAAMSIGIPVTSVQAASARKSEEGISWHKGVCRFCGTAAASRSASATTASSPRRATPTRPSTAASTASRATSTPRSCTAGTV